MDLSTVFVFDLDGVLVDPTTKKVTQEENLEILKNLLHSGNMVGFNTGRSNNFVEKQLIKPLIKIIEDKNDLKNLFISCEKGAVTVGFDNNFQPVLTKNDNISVPSSVQEKIKKLVNNKFTDAMFFDETKLTMVSVEMNDGHDILDYWCVQKEFDKDLEKIVLENNLSENFKIDTSRISTDLESKVVGKDLGTENFINWCKQNQKPIDKIIFFGDSKSDLKMIEPAEKYDILFEFVFVGHKDYLKELNINFPITFTKNLYEAGVMEYFKNL